MLELYRRQSVVDMVTVHAELTRRGTAEGVGGLAYLIELSREVPSTANVKAYVQLVSDKSTFRKLIKAAQAIVQDSYSQQNALEDTLNLAEKSIFDISMHNNGGDTLMPVRDVLYGTYANIE